MSSNDGGRYHWNPLTTDSPCLDKSGKAKSLNLKQRMQNSLWRVFFSENANLQNHCWCKLLVVKVGLRYRTECCRLCWILSEVQQPTSLRIHKSDLILGRYPPVILNVTRITAIPRLILIDPLSLTMPCLQVKDIIIPLRVSAEQWPLFKWKTRLITTSFTIVAARTRTCTQHIAELRFKEENKPVLKGYFKQS